MSVDPTTGFERNGRPNWRSDRDRYADVGRAMRESIEALLEPGSLTARRARVHLAVLYLTASYSKLTDRLYVAQIAAVARIPGDDGQRHTRRALKELAELGVIEWNPGHGRSRLSSVSLRADGQKTQPLLAIVSAEKTRPIQTPKPGRSVGKPGRSEQENPAISGGPTEKVYREDHSEKNDEEHVAGSIDDLKETLDLLLRGFGYISDSQRREFETAYLEDDLGFEECTLEAATGERPAALLTKMIRSDGHRRYDGALRKQLSGGPLYAAYVREKGYPTGSEFMRSNASGTYRPNPLGHDRPPYDVPWGKPTPQEVIAALEERGWQP